MQIRWETGSWMSRRRKLTGPKPCKKGKKCVRILKVCMAVHSGHSFFWAHIRFSFASCSCTVS